VDSTPTNVEKIHKEAEEKAQQKINDIIDDLRKKNPEKPPDQFMAQYGEVYAALTEMYIRGYADALAAADCVVESPDTQS
jgi:phosphoketolase